MTTELKRLRTSKNDDRRRLCLESSRLDWQPLPSVQLPREVCSVFHSPTADISLTRKAKLGVAPEALKFFISFRLPECQGYMLDTQGLGSD
mmetsp:Transcript_2450/g.4549  ORF Transcript_2450/g.4549 Transcript_2450/m.4549 type:complete len:91 (-) Transcript_2450:64-336(-)